MKSILVFLTVGSIILLAACGGGNDASSGANDAIAEACANDPDSIACADFCENNPENEFCV